MAGNVYASPIIGYDGSTSNVIVENATVTGTYSSEISYFIIQIHHTIQIK